MVSEANMEDSLPQEDGHLPFPMAWTAEAVEGWLMLENVTEAAAELATIPSELRHHPTILSLEWKTATAAGKPAQAWRAAKELCQLRPHLSAPWICQANA